MLLCNIIYFVDFHYELLRTVWTVWTIKLLMYMVSDECGIYLYVWTCCIEVKYSSHICVWIASKNREIFAKIFCLQYVLISVISLSDSLSNQFVFLLWVCMYASRPTVLVEITFSFMQKNRTWLCTTLVEIFFSFLPFYAKELNMIEVWNWIGFSIMSPSNRLFSVIQNSDWSLKSNRLFNHGI